MSDFGIVRTGGRGGRRKRAEKGGRGKGGGRVGGGGEMNGIVVCTVYSSW